MTDQPRLEPLEASHFFSDGRGSRPLVAGTVPRGTRCDQIVRESQHFLTGVVDGQLTDALPPEVVQHGTIRQLIRRGQDRYGAFCSHCHDLLGTGQGFVVQRGYPRPPTYHSDRLRAATLGHLFRVITDGKGRMPPHGRQIPPADRWAIAAYLRALQFSQYADTSRLESQDVNALNQLDKVAEKPR